ncbi:hypothetical protein BJV82DRAFT_595372 [Fennellomyces sp. T-0311]|nr:hypothetical protein BJV82DRAFT_595372 [Fennellomyces sp. T-0311]
MSNQGCKTLYLCNLDSRVNESILCAILSTIASVDQVQMEQDTDCWSLADGDTCHHAYAQFHDHHNAAQAYLAIDGRSLYGRCVVAKWKEPRSQAHFSIYIPPVTNTAMLLQPFKETLVDLRPAWNESTGKFTNASIASFISREAAESALRLFNGKSLDNTRLHCQMDALPCIEFDEMQSDSASEDDDSNTCYEQIFAEAPLHVTTIQISDLPSDATKQMIVSSFQQYGYVSHVYLQPADKEGQGYALVSMDTHANAAMTIFSLQNLKFGDNSIGAHLSWYQGQSDAFASKTTSPHLTIPGAPQKVLPQISELNSYSIQPMWSSSASMATGEEDVGDSVRWSNVHNYEYYHGTVFNT